MRVKGAKNKIDEKYASINETEKILDICRSTVLQMIKDKKLKTYTPKNSKGARPNIKIVRSSIPSVETFVKPKRGRRPALVDVFSSKEVILSEEAK